MSHLPKFLKLAGSEDIVLPGDAIIAEEFQVGPVTRAIETSDGRKVELIMAAHTDGRQVASIEDERPMLLRVLMVGRGYYSTDNDGKEKFQPLDVQPGYIIEVPKMSVTWRSEFCGLVADKTSRFGRTLMDNVLAWWPSEEAYKRVQAIMKGEDK